MKRILEMSTLIAAVALALTSCSPSEMEENSFPLQFLPTVLYIVISTAVVIAVCIILVKSIILYRRIRKSHYQLRKTIETWNLTDV